jgi:excisionase family DNA binding protein
MSEIEPADSFLTVAEVADLLKLNQQTVRNWIDAGTLPAFRVGRRVRILRADLDQILSDGRQGHAASGWAPGDLGGPNADDFWGGEPVGSAQVDPEFRDQHA